MLHLSLDNKNLILLAHGDGGALTHDLINNLFRRHFTARELRPPEDAALLPSRSGRLALTTDSFVVTPLFFPGGDLGKLAVWGTVNDLAVSGASPQYLAAAFILEEGLPLSTLEKIVTSMACACRQAGVKVVTGDTKVVPQGQLDKLFITTTGVGWVPEHIDLGCHRIRPGDLLLVNGSLGDHGMTILAARYALDLGEVLRSDCAPLNNSIALLLQHCQGIKLLRDLTRGGLATVVKETAVAAGVDIYLDEAALPVGPEVQTAAAILGLDPLYLANEGRFLVAIDPREAGTALDLLRNKASSPLAAPVGVVKGGKGEAWLRTVLGGTKSLELLAGTPLPRIC